jgi:ribulose-5-phosphate 4-epimerase/fuculose-1-phosphate aldolase
MGKLSHICNDAGLVPASSESEARQQLAALHHLYQHFGWTDLIYTHISARVPDGSGRYLIKPDELLMDEVTASRLVKTDINQTTTTGGSSPNLAGHLIHTAVLKARPEVNFIAHTHSRAGAAVSCMKRGLLPLSQHANIILPTVAYHDYMDVTVAEQECDALGRDLGSNYLMIMRNHGLLSVGRTVAECFYYLYYLEMACKIQVDVLASGEEPILASKETVEGLFRFGGAPQEYPPGVRVWPAAIRILQRKGANYED